MSLALIFHKLVSGTFSVSDESTNIGPLPVSGQSDGLVLKSSVELALSLDMTGRVVREGSATIILHRRCLFTVMSPENQQLWMRESGNRPLHPHEVQSIGKLRGALPETVVNELSIPWMLAEQLRARCGLGLGGQLIVERGWVELTEVFSASGSTNPLEKGFIG
jgi:hypothetical protein